MGVPSHEIFIARRSFVLGVSRQHALDAHADALDILHGAPALRAQQVEADDAVGVNMGVDGNDSIGRGDECHFRRFYSTFNLSQIKERKKIQCKS